jgi:putative hydrolase
VSPHPFPEEFRDINVEVASHLSDLALMRESRHAKIAYKRASRAVLGLEVFLDDFAAQRPVREIPYIGPATERVVLEHLELGRSPTVERALEKSGKRAEVEKARSYRTHFLSRAGVLAVLRADAKDAIAPESYRGDLQTHSEWSDGAEHIGLMAAAAKARGHSYIGISDHSYGLRIAHGMSMERAAERRRQIEELNRRESAGNGKGAFRIITAIEANIPFEGGVDMTTDELAEFELVLAAPHSRLRRPEDQTGRMLATVRHPGVHILAHPRGRMYSRQGVLARWDEVFEEAARQGVAIEIDGDPYRQDLDYSLARRALAAGCLFALDSDAHASDELESADFALAHARLAGITAERVINTWSADELLDWARHRSARRRGAAIPTRVF